MVKGSRTAYKVYPCFESRDRLRVIVLWRVLTVFFQLLQRVVENLNAIREHQLLDYLIDTDDIHYAEGPIFEESHDTANPFDNDGRPRDASRGGICRRLIET